MPRENAPKSVEADLISFSNDFPCDPELLKTCSRVSIGEMENLIDSMGLMDESAFPESEANESINGKIIYILLYYVLLTMPVLMKLVL